MKKITLMLISLLFLSFISYAQEVTGTVVDENGDPLPGVSIQVQGTSRGAITDFDGKYTVNANIGDVLLFSYVGFNSRQVTVTSNTVDVILQSGVELENVVVIGSRNVNRTATDTAVPVDVLDVSELASSTPQITVTEILNYAAPSFVSNPQTISDGTDHIAPASLRGLGPDQVLVLINGKRRHKTSLINVNGTFGRGSVGTDLTAIPANAIERIEILRDGAAAQYGSDAIAGVINIVLKRSTEELTVDVTTGANFTSETSPEKNVDGEKINVGLNYGLPIGEDNGFINFTGNFNFRGFTNRMQEWEGQIFNAYNSIERVAAADGYDTSLLLDDDFADIFTYAGAAGVTLTGGETLEDLQGILAADVTETELATRGQVRSDYNMRVGQSELRGGQFFMNLGIPLGEDLELYGNAGLGYKNGNAAGFYRLPYQARAYTPAYINGFRPEINTNINDQSATLGLKGMLGDWNADMSNTYGRNSFLFRITNSNNASLANSTPFEADAGGFNYSENTTNFDMSRFFEDALSGLNIAFGAEYRVENYAIVAGEESSYAQYNEEGNVHDPTDPTSVVPTDFFGDNRPGGIQVFPGFKPENEIDAFRNSVAAYFDVEADISDMFLLSGAVRYENYSDFGGTINFKLASRIKASENVNIRGGLQTGFRAPSLHQIHFNSTSTIFVDGIPNEVGIFPNTSRVARILGIPSLKEETSFGATAGFTAKIPTANMRVTVDGYLVNIDDRVVLTGQFNDNGNPELATLFAQANASQAAFFANAVDTQTKGLDIVVEHNGNISANLRIRNMLALTFAETTVENVAVPDAIASVPGLPDIYFDPTSRIYLEAAVPRTKGNLSHNLTLNENWNFFLRNSYFGEVEEATNNTDAGIDRLYGGKVITDLTVGHDIDENITLTIGANNLLDVYPDIGDPAFQSSGRFLYSRRSVQFGTNGRHLFARLQFKLK